MCWFSFVGGAVNKGISYAARACGLPEKKRKSLESVLNVMTGSVGAFVDPVGGGILVTRGILQATGTSKRTTEGVNAAAHFVDTHFHDKAIEKALEIAEHWAEIGGF